jgi:hypothetical protein
MPAPHTAAPNQLAPPCRAPPRTQAFALAPLFVWFELLFLLGYRPQLHAAVEKRIQAAIAAWRRSQGGKAR